jgi:hypothetical protein
MTPDEVRVIEAGAEAATPGPFSIVYRGCQQFGYDIMPGPDYEGQFSAMRGMFGRREDAEFYASAHTDVLALLAEVVRLQHELERAIKAGPEDYDWDVLSRIDKLDECEAEATRLRIALEDCMLVVNTAAEQGPAVCQVRVIVTRSLLGKGATG